MIFFSSFPSPSPFPPLSPSPSSSPLFHWQLIYSQVSVIPPLYSVGDNWSPPENRVISTISSTPPPPGAKSWLVLWHAGLPFSAHYAWQTTQWLFCCLFNYPSLAFINFLLLQSNNVLGAYPWTIVTQEHKLSDDGCLLQLYISYFVSSSAQFKFLAASQTLLTIGINWRGEKP